MQTRILAFSGNKQSGKSTYTNFLHGYQMRCQGIIDNFKIVDGQLAITTNIINQDKEEEMANRLDNAGKSHINARTAGSDFGAMQSTKAYSVSHSAHPNQMVGTVNSFNGPTTDSYARARNKSIKSVHS